MNEDGLAAERVQALLVAGARPNVQDEDGETPLHYAAQLGRQRVAAALLAAGPDRAVRNQKQETPEEVAGAERKAFLKYWTSGYGESEDEK